MATLARKILTANAMGVRVSCAGMSYVGISLAGTWVGTVTFEASQSVYGLSGPGGGSDFKTVGAYAWPPGSTTPTPVQTATANGSWYWPVQDYATFRARFTQTSGSVVATLAAAIDSTWADAFLNPSGKFVNSFANGTRNLLTIPSDANLGKRLRSLVVSVAAHVGGGSGTGSSSSAGPASAGWASNPILQIKDGSTVLYATDLPTALPFQYVVPLPQPQVAQLGVTDGGVYATPGNPLVIDLASAGSGVTTNLNGEICNA